MQPQNLQIQPGAVVLARDGYVGTVDEVIPSAATGRPEYFVTAPNQTGERLMVPVSLVDINSRPGEIYLREIFQTVLQHSRTIPAGVDPRTLLQQTTTPSYPGNYPAAGIVRGIGQDSRVVLPVTEEKLEVGKRTVELGALELHKTVEHFQDSRRIPLTFDQLEVERVAVNRQLDAPLEPRYEGDVLIIPVMEEVLVVEKRLMLIEEVRISKRQEVREQEVNETLRREHLKIANPDNDLIRVNDLSTPTVAPGSQNQVAAGPGPVVSGEGPAAPYMPLGTANPAPAPPQSGSPGEANQLYPDGL
jgi:uncharacterized protein (TIGR02271 family)